MYRERPVSRMQLHVRDVEEPHHGNRSDGISRDTADEPDEENRNGGRANEDSIQEKEEEEEEEEEAYSPQPTARNGSEFQSNLVCSPEAFRSLGLLAAFSDNGEDEEMGRDFESRENVSGTSPHDDGDGSRRISERASGLKPKSLATNSFDPFSGPNFRAEKKPRDVDLFKEYSRNDPKKHKERVWDDRADCSRNYSKNVTMTQKFRQEDDDDDDDDDDDEERDEEIAILKSMLYYHSENGVFPSGSKKFRNFVSNVLRVDISEHQLKDQIHRLKNRYKKIVGKRGRSPKFSRTRDREAFQLSEKIWGNAADISEDHSKLSAGKHRKRRRFGEEQNASECSHKGRSSQSAKREGLKSVVGLPKLLQDKRRRLMQEFELEAQRVKLSWEKMELGLEKLRALYGSLVTNSAHHDYLNSSL